jgi:hypothetical protein
MNQKTPEESTQQVNEWTFFALDNTYYSPKEPIEAEQKAITKARVTENRMPETRQEWQNAYSRLPDVAWRVYVTIPNKHHIAADLDAIYEKFWMPAIDRSGFDTLPSKPRKTIQLLENFKLVTIEKNAKGRIIRIYKTPLQSANVCEIAYTFAKRYDRDELLEQDQFTPTLGGIEYPHAWRDAITHPQQIVIPEPEKICDLHADIINILEAEKNEVLITDLREALKPMGYPELHEQEFERTITQLIKDGRAYQPSQTTIRIL